MTGRENEKNRLEQCITLGKVQDNMSGLIELHYKASQVKYTYNLLS